MSLVEARGLVKRFGSFTAVNDVSFSVQRGEVVGFLGPNGAGKSTTMKIIAGFLEPNAGEAFLDGHNTRTDPMAARKILGYLPEGAPAYPDMTVGAFLEFVAGMRGLDAATARQRLRNYFHYLYSRLRRFCIASASLSCRQVRHSSWAGPDICRNYR